MSLTSEQVDHIAKLARIELLEGESEPLRVQLSSILDYVSQLQGIDTEGIEPMNYVTSMENVWGEDEVVGCSAEERKIILDDFPEREADLLKVKAVFS